MNNSIFISIHRWINAVKPVLWLEGNELIQCACLEEKQGRQCHYCDWLLIPPPARPGTDGSGVRCHLHTPRSHRQSPPLEPRKPPQTRFLPSAGQIKSLWMSVLFVMSGKYNIWLLTQSYRMIGLTNSNLNIHRILNKNPHSNAKTLH